MVDFEVNPEDIDEIFLDSLNEAYDQWGSRELYDWSVKRKVGMIESDIILARVNGEPAYGAVLYYRNVKTGEGRSFRSCIIGDGWTLPKFRGRGLSTIGIGKGMGIAFERGCSLMIGIGRVNNVSQMNMTVNGGEIVPASYVHVMKGKFIKNTGLSIKEVDISPSLLDRLVHLNEREKRGACHFSYDPPEWESQFVERPQETILLSIEDSTFIALERDSNVDRILSVISDGTISFTDAFITLYQWSGKDVFHYTSVPGEIEDLKRFEPRITDGYLALFRSGYLDIEGGWKVHNGDRM